MLLALPPVLTLFSINTPPSNVSAASPTHHQVAIVKVCRFPKPYNDRSHSPPGRASCAPASPGTQRCPAHAQGGKEGGGTVVNRGGQGRWTAGAAVSSEFRDPAAAHSGPAGPGRAWNMQHTLARYPESCAASAGHLGCSWRNSPQPRSNKQSRLALSTFSRIMRSFSKLSWLFSRRRRVCGRWIRSRGLQGGCSGSGWMRVDSGKVGVQAVHGGCARAACRVVAVG